MALVKSPVGTPIKRQRTASVSKCLGFIVVLLDSNESIGGETLPDQGRPFNTLGAKRNVDYEDFLRAETAVEALALPRPLTISEVRLVKVGRPCRH